MIITALLNLLLFVLNVLSSIFGSLIPDLPSSIDSLLDTITSVINSGFSFLSYFVHWQAVVVLLSVTLGWVAFVNIKNIVMKVIGHFLAN